MSLRIVSGNVAALVTLSCFVALTNVSAASDRQDAQLILLTPRESFPNNSDVVLRLKLENKGAAPIPVFRTNGNSQGELEFRFTVYRDGVQASLTKYGKVLAGKAEGLTISDGGYIMLGKSETFEDEVVISHVYDMSASGKYVVKAFWQSDDRDSIETHSRPVIVYVR